MNDQNKGLDIERVKQIALDNGFQLKEQASGNYDLHSYVYQFAEKLLEDKQTEINQLESRLAEHVKRNGLYPTTLPDDICWWFHPDFKYIDPMADCHDERGYTEEEWKQIQDLGQVDITFDTSVSAFDIEEALGRETDGEWTGWNPEPPTPEHFLIAAFDTDHVECVLWWAKRRNNADIENLKTKLESGEYLLVPKQPTMEQYGGLARDLVRYLQTNKRWSPITLTTYLQRFGIDMPDWLKQEVPNPESDHHFAKGDIVALIYKAALYDAPQHQPQGENHEQQ